MRNGLLYDEPLSDDAALSEAALDDLLKLAHRRLDPALRRIRRERVAIGVANTPLGRLLIVQSDRGLMTVRFLDIGDSAAFMAGLREQCDLDQDDAMRRSSAMKLSNSCTVTLARSPSVRSICGWSRVTFNDAR